MSKILYSLLSFSIAFMLYGFLLQLCLPLRYQPPVDWPFTAQSRANYNPWHPDMR